MTEMLVVIGVIVLMLGLTAPALVEIARGQGIKRAVAEISGIVEQGRIEAMATNAWVWVGLHQENPDDDSELVAVLMTSKDGSANMAAGNLRMLTRPVRLEGVKVLPTLTDWAVDAGVVPLAGSNFSFTEEIRGESVTFGDTVLGFNPRGEAFIVSGAVSPWIEIGLREVRGAVEIPEKTASIRVSGFSGQQIVDY